MVSVSVVQAEASTSAQNSVATPTKRSNRSLQDFIVTWADLPSEIWKDWRKKTTKSPDEAASSEDGWFVYGEARSIARNDCSQACSTIGGHQVPQSFADLTSTVSVMAQPYLRGSWQHSWKIGGDLTGTLSRWLMTWCKLKINLQRRSWRDQLTRMVALCGTFTAILKHGKISMKKNLVTGKQVIRGGGLYEAFGSHIHPYSGRTLMKGNLMCTSCGSCGRISLKRCTSLTTSTLWGLFVCRFEREKCRQKAYYIENLRFVCFLTCFFNFFVLPAHYSLSDWRYLCVSMVRLRRWCNFTY